jgi:hypothetical protein
MATSAQGHPIIQMVSQESMLLTIFMNYVMGIMGFLDIA